MPVLTYDLAMAAGRDAGTACARSHGADVATFGPVWSECCSDAAAKETNRLLDAMEA